MYNRPVAMCCKLLLENNLQSELLTGSNTNGHMTMNLELHTNNDSLPVLLYLRRKYLFQLEEFVGIFFSFFMIKGLFRSVGGINSP